MIVHLFESLVEFQSHRERSSAVSIMQLPVSSSFSPFSCCVGMIGGGVNDALVLAASTVSIATGAADGNANVVSMLCFQWRAAGKRYPIH